MSLEQTPARLAAGLPAAPGVCAYADFYAFVESPFGMTPNTRFVFWGGSVSIALEQVMLGLGAREGVMVITGDTGTGKTMLCRALAHHLRQDAFLSMVVNPTLGPTDLLRQILDDFGVTSHSPHPSAGTNYELFRTLEQFLVARIPQGDRAVVLIDEAHHLQPDVLEQIRLLSNLESQDAKLLQIVMVGRPDLEAVLGQPEQRELNQRVSRHCQVLPLTPTEMERYINHRMAVAQATSANTVDDPTPVEPVLMSDGATGGLQVRQVAFTPAALAAIATFSHGVPRIINVLCDRALERGYAREARTIDGAHVLGAAVQLKLNAAPGTRRVDVRIVAAAAAVAALIAVGIGTHSLWIPGAPRTEAVATPVAGTVHPISVPIPIPIPNPIPVTGPLETARPVTLAVAAFKTEQPAAALVTKLVGLGLPAFDRHDAPNGWHQVTVGPYASVEEARTAQRRITGVGLINAPVISIGPIQKAGRRPDLPPRPAVLRPEADVLGRARALAQVPDVRALMRLHDDLMRRGRRDGQLESDDFKQRLEAVDRYTNDARALQLQIDGRGFRGADPGATGAAGRSGSRGQ